MMGVMDSLMGGRALAVAAVMALLAQTVPPLMAGKAAPDLHRVLQDRQFSVAAAAGARFIPELRGLAAQAAAGREHIMATPRQELTISVEAVEPLAAKLERQ
jgi:hypothetical protein